MIRMQRSIRPTAAGAGAVKIVWSKTYICCGRPGRPSRTQNCSRSRVKRRLEAVEMFDGSYYTDLHQESAFNGGRVVGRGSIWYEVRHFRQAANITVALGDRSCLQKCFAVVLF